MERITGADALFLHLDRRGTPLHTLKVAVLDYSRRGRPVTLDELRSAVGTRLGVIPRATQRVVKAPGFGGRPFWVEDPNFSLDAHLDECTLDPPGGQAQLDTLYSELATKRLDQCRPLWSMTLVHGLAEPADTSEGATQVRGSGRCQAVVVRVHHAVTDGLGAVNLLMACTTSSPWEVVPRYPPESPARARRVELFRRAMGDVGPWAREFGRVVTEGVRSWRRARAFRAEAPDLPPFLGSKRNFANARSGARRVCASASLAFDDVRAVAKATDTSVNGVLHAVIASAMRKELLERGADLTTPTVAAFGISADPTESPRRWGNHVTPTNVALFSNLDDPMGRLRYTARSCREGVELRRTTGLNMASKWADYTCRLGPAFQRAFAYRWPRIVNHVTTANVPGPGSTRWVGAVEVIQWFSFAVAVAPSNVNVTVYSYAGRMNIGLVTTPEVFSDPHAFTDHMASSLVELTHATIGPAG
jgi:WS/DGAT/MGAT family acyltransferase